MAAARIGDFKYRLKTLLPALLVYLSGPSGSAWTYAAGDALRGARSKASEASEVARKPHLGVGGGALDDCSSMFPIRHIISYVKRRKIRGLYGNRNRTLNASSHWHLEPCHPGAIGCRTCGLLGWLAHLHPQSP